MTTLYDCRKHDGFLSSNPISAFIAAQAPPLNSSSSVWELEPLKSRPNKVRSRCSANTEHFYRDIFFCFESCNTAQTDTVIVLKVFFSHCSFDHFRVCCWTREQWLKVEMQPGSKINSWLICQQQVNYLTIFFNNHKTALCIIWLIIISSSI